MPDISIIIQHCTGRCSGNGIYQLLIDAAREYASCPHPGVLLRIDDVACFLRCEENGLFYVETGTVTRYYGVRAFEDDTILLDPGSFEESINRLIRDNLPAGLKDEFDGFVRDYALRHSARIRYCVSNPGATH